MHTYIQCICILKNSYVCMCMCCMCVYVCRNKGNVSAYKYMQYIQTHTKFTIHTHTCIYIQYTQYIQYIPNIHTHTYTYIYIHLYIRYIQYMLVHIRYIQIHTYTTFLKCIYVCILYVLYRINMYVNVCACVPKYLYVCVCMHFW